MKGTTLLSSTLLVSGLFFASNAARCQTYHIACQVPASAGGQGSIQGKNYAFTLGEPVIATFWEPGSNTTLTQGFHQPECSDAPLVGVQKEQPEFQVSLFPNPSSEALWLQFTPAPGDICTAQVFDLLGQPASPPLTLQAGEMMPVDVSALPPGLYFLQVKMQGETHFPSLPFVKMN